MDDGPEKNWVAPSVPLQDEVEGLEPMAAAVPVQEALGDGHLPAEASAWSPTLEAVWTSVTPEDIPVPGHPQAVVDISHSVGGGAQDCARPAAPTVPAWGGPISSQAAAAAPSPLRVYSRQRRRDKAPAPMARSPQSSGSDSPLRKLEKLRKPVDMLLPLPVIQKRRKKGPPPGSLPRRSRRVAGAGPCSPGQVVTAAQRKVMRQLGFEEKEIIGPEAQDKYSKLFKPLNNESHVAAMAAIFGWEVGDGEQVRAADILTIL